MKNIVNFYSRNAYVYASYELFYWYKLKYRKYLIKDECI